ncbi:hypothetical protein AM10699_67270 (plasmid) [Acaryochloris marina MBIC10699]|nr:hypothetical protein AM10699_67270 [Acaryochloris marina MBIC10699]
MVVVYGQQPKLEFLEVGIALDESHPLITCDRVEEPETFPFLCESFDAFCVSDAQPMLIVRFPAMTMREFDLKI